MPDWTKSMQQTFEYYIVDPGTWENDRLLDNVKKSTLNRDTETETLGSATFDVTSSVGECYIRVYLVTIQNGITEKFPLGTYLVQTPSSSFNGKVRSVSMDAYTPLIELKEDQPPLGYYVSNNSNIMEYAYRNTRDHVRAPVVKPSCDINLYKNFVANTDDTWLSFNSDLASEAKYILDLDEMGRIIFSPKRDISAMTPVWTFTDDNSSILTPDISIEHDLYGVPNVVEVIYSDEYHNYYSKVINDDPNSPTSTVNRGREIVQRITNPESLGVATPLNVEAYAKRALKELSTVSYTLTYTHGYCPVRLGDCIRMNYNRAGITDIKGMVVSQKIKCEPGCQVTEKAIFVTKLWGDGI